MLNRFFTGLLVVFFIPVLAQAQSTNAPLNKDYYHLLDRLEILNNSLAPAYHSAIKPYTRRSIAEMLDSANNNSPTSARAESFNRSYMAQDNWEWAHPDDSINERALWNTIYKRRSDFLYGRDKKKAISIHANPVMYLSVGGETADSRYTYINTRGVQIHGMIDEKVGFYTFLGENQIRTPLYVRDWINQYKVVPGEGFRKSFGDQGYDFFTAMGYISFNATKHINFQFGHDRQFWGDGYRSLIWSDFGPPVLFLKINTNVWRLNYTNLFTQVYADAYGQSGGSVGGTQFPRKYIISHRLSFNIGRHVNLGVYESVVFGREDSQGNSHFELAYLNPIIFYRAIEHQNGSLDNVLLGIDAKWNFLKHFSLYGQWFLDEMLFDQFFNNPGWWGNKFAYQVGLKYIDVANVSNLDLQLEYNSARPYTYTHSSIYSNYAHYRQPVAHPMGANFKEFIAIARYQPIPKLNIATKIIIANYGLDPTNQDNFGKEILKDYTTRNNDEGNFIGQGVATDLTYFDLTATYMPWHNIFIDGKLIYRDQSSADPQFNQNSTIYTLSVRWNIAQRLQEF